MPSRSKKFEAKPLTGPPISRIHHFKRFPTLTPEQVPPEVHQALRGIFSTVSLDPASPKWRKLTDENLPES